ncbi:hypothetical protein SynROS8604_00413 [Synechococcus sp. ROS8604]|nr:hypothetical protein SynROS8604_00413 [Synechococcus sp. ROS8604]
MGRRPGKKQRRALVLSGKGLDPDFNNTLQQRPYGLESLQRRNPPPRLAARLAAGLACGRAR